MKINVTSIFLVFISFGSFSQSVEKEAKIKFTVPVTENFSYGNWALAPDGKSFQVLFYKTFPGYLAYPAGVGTIVDRTGLISLGGVSFYQVSEELEVKKVEGLVKSESHPYKKYKAFVPPNVQVGEGEVDLTIGEWGQKFGWNKDLVPLNTSVYGYQVKQQSTATDEQPYNNSFSNQMSQFGAMADFGRAFTIAKGYEENYWDENYNLPNSRINWGGETSVTFENSTLGSMTPEIQFGIPDKKQILFVWNVALAKNKDMGQLFRNFEFRLWSEDKVSKPVLNLTLDYARTIKNIGLVPGGNGYYTIWKKRPFMAAKYSDPDKTGHAFVWTDTNNVVLSNTRFVFPFNDPNANIQYTFYHNDQLHFVMDGLVKSTTFYGFVSFDKQGKYTSTLISRDSIYKYLSPRSLPFLNDIKGIGFGIESHRMLKDGTVLFTLNGTISGKETVKNADGGTFDRNIRVYNGTLFLHTTKDFQLVQSYFVPKSDKKEGFSNAHLVQIVEEKDNKLKILFLEPSLSKSKREIASELFPKVWSEKGGETKLSNVGTALLRPKYALLDLASKDVQVKESVNPNFYLENGGQIKVKEGYIYLMGREAGKNDLQISQTEPLEINYVFQKVKW